MACSRQVSTSSAPSVNVKVSQESDAKIKELLLQSSAAPLASLTPAGENKGRLSETRTRTYATHQDPHRSNQDIHNWKLPPNVKCILTPMNNPVIHQE